MIISIIPFILSFFIGLLCSFSPDKKLLILILVFVAIIFQAIDLSIRSKSEPPSRSEFYEMATDIKAAISDSNGTPDIHRLKAIADKYHITLEKLLNDLESGNSLQRGINALLNKRYEEANILFDQNIKTTSGEMGTTYFYIGRVNHLLMNYEIANNAYRNALEYLPDDPQILTNWGNLFAMQYNYDSAIAKHKEALTSKSDYWPAMANLANTYRQKGDFSLALIEIEKAMTLKPDNASILLNCGSILDSLGKKGQAMECYNKVLQIDPLNAQAYVNIGNKKDLSSATPYYEKALQIDPTNAYALYNWGTKLLDAGQIEAAETKLRRAIESNPIFPEALHNLGNLLFEKKNFEESENFLMQAVSIAPQNASINFSLGETLRELGKHTLAKKYYKIAIDIDVKYNIGAYGPGRYYKEFFLYPSKPYGHFTSEQSN